jgi:hypothetical protein
MKIFKELKKLGYIHYSATTIEELDDLPLNSAERVSEQALVLRWFREKYNLVHTVYSNASGYIWELHYNQERGGTHICDSGESGDCEMSGMFTTYEKAEFECLGKLIEIVKNK